MITKKEKNKNKSRRKFIAASFLIVLGFLLGVNKDGISSYFGQNVPLGRFTNTFSSDVIGTKELKKALGEKDFLLVNVHTPYEGEIEKTDLFVNYDEIVANKDKFPGDKNAKIVLYCKSGNMSQKALGTLKNLGYANVVHLSGGMDSWEDSGYEVLNLKDLSAKVVPDEGFELPVSWGDYAKRLVELGVIDKQKFSEVVQMTDEEKQILDGNSDKPIKITLSNSQFVVDVLWALGLAQKSKVYDEGPMGKEYKDQAGNFASTGGWSLAKGNAVNYLNKFDLIGLDEDMQNRVGEIAQNVYRPCCGNSTWFPDCNHGMAALAAIELMVKKGLDDEEIYRNVLKLNSVWFPQNYLTTATYFERQGVSWDKVDAKLVLGQEYSSAQGAQDIFKKVGPLPYEQGTGGGSCGA